MTFIETKELLLWARANRVAQFKCGEVEATFYPDKDTGSLSSPDVADKPSDWAKWVDQACGLDGLDAPIEARVHVSEVRK